MSKIKAFFKEYSEELLYKVSWPTWEELQSSTVIVLVATLIIAVIIYAADLIFGKTLAEFYKLF